MLLHNFILVLSICLILITRGINAMITQGPSNTVAEVGKQVNLNCTADANIAYWILSNNGDSNGELTIVGPGCSTVNAPFGDHYTVESFGGGSICNLIVFNITMEQAGVYKCLQGSNVLASILTVIDSSPVITVNGTTVVENESVLIECVLRYNGSMPPAPTLRPYFYWTNSTGQNVSSYYDSTTENTAVSQLIVTAGRQDIMPYACRVYLQLIPSTYPSYASNTPTVDMSANSPTIEVLYGPSIPVITIAYRILEIHGIACEVGVLTCSSSGNPQPSYEWFDTKENVGILSNDATFDLAESNWNYTCVAKNTLRNEVYQEISFHVYTSQTDVQDCKFPRNESTWITVTGCDAMSPCVCSQGRGGLTLICHALTYPNALFVWKGTDENIVYSQVHDYISSNGTYYCTAYFDRALSNYTGNAIFSNGRSEKTVAECSISITASSTSATMESSTPASPFKKRENVIPTEMMIHSKGTSEPSPYEELRRPDESQLHQTTYEELSPNYITHDGKQS